MEVNKDITEIKLDTKYNSLATKCKEFIKTSKIDYDIDYFINNETMNRFLIARENNEKDAYIMWETWVKWRIDYLPDKITLESIKKELKIGKIFLNGYDPENRPILIIKTGLHIPGESDFDELNRLGIYWMEKGCALADQNGSKQIVAIIDRENSGFKNFERRLITKKGIVSMLQDFYAERLHKIYIIHVNFVFRTIFAMIRPFLSTRTNDKLVLCSSVNDLKKYFSVENLMKEHGGKNEYKYEIPTL